jgi:hypothetical protein
MEDLVNSLDALDLPEHVKTLLRTLQPTPIPNLDVLVSRLSLIRTFTERSFDAAAGGLVPVPPFETFIASSEVEPVIGYPGRFSIVERVRSQHLLQWNSQPDDRARWAHTLAEVLDPSDPIEDLDRSQVLFLADQKLARAALIKAFDAADSADDIAKCSALVQLVTSTIQLFGDDQSRALLNEMRSRSQARNLFFAEFYQSARYYPRPIDDEIRRFAQATDDQWIFHLHATGGMGKTMLLRRMISHEWVLGLRHVPCAWLDFDYLEVSTVLQHPALLGLAMAAQWNEQLEQPVFGSFLDPSLQPLASLLFRNRGDASVRGLTTQTLDNRSRNQYRAGLSNPMRCGMLAGAVPPRTFEERAQRMSQASILLSYWTDKLPDAIAAMPADRPVLLVLDTLEEASLQHGQELLETLRLLAILRQQTQKLAKERGRPPVNLRLVLSGRHQLGKEHVPEFKTEFANQYVEHRLTGLEDTEARAFLDQEIRENAHSAHRAELIEAMVRKSEGIPFNLSLFAEWANNDDRLDANTVVQSEDVSTAMLIERIIKRIPYQPLRWIIRYGVVPRNLSRDFLRDVMREPLLDALSGRASSEGVDKPDSATEQDVWKEEPNFTFDADVLWDQHVVRYASERSWMTPGELPQQVAFRSDILQPMRRLLGKQPIFERLHERSRDWFGAQMGDPSTWSVATIERLYHEVQLRAIQATLGGPVKDFLPALRQMLDAAPLTTDPRLRAAICAELFRPDFADLTFEERAYVRYRLAEALAAENDYSYRTPEAVRCLVEAFEPRRRRRRLGTRWVWLEGEISTPPTLPPFASVWKDAVDSKSPSTILENFEDLPADDVLRASLLVAELSDPGSRLVSDTLKSAITISQGMTHSPIPLGVIAARLAQNLRDTDPEGAARYFMMAAGDFDARGDQTKRSDMLRMAAETELNLGRLTRAEAILTQPDVERTLTVRLQLARLELAKGNPDEARGVLAVGDKRAFDVNLGAFVDPSWSTEELVITAEALSQQMFLREASDVWERASRSASLQGDSNALIRIAIGQAKLYCWWLRAVPAATPNSVLSLLRRSQFMKTVSADTAADEIEVWQILYDQTDVDRWRRRAMGELGGVTPTGRVRLIFALSQVITPFPRKRWEELIAHAGQIPPSARVAALAEPVLEGEPPKLDLQTRTALAQAFRHIPEGEIEAAWYAIRYSELLVWLGFYDEAIALLARLIPRLDASDHGKGWRPTVYRQRRRIEQRIRDWEHRSGKAPALPPPDPDPPDLWWNFWGRTPFRASVALVENAQRARDAGRLELMHACLDRAAPGLEQVHLETAFHVMAARLRGVDPNAIGEMALPAGARITTPASAVEETPGSSRLGGPWFSVLGMHEQSGRVAVQLENPVREQVTSAENRSLEILLRSRGIPRRLVGMPLDTIAADLGAIVSQTELDFSQRIALKIPLSALCCAPWEMVFRDATLLPFRLPSQWDEAEVDIGGRIDNNRTEDPPSGPVLLQPLSQQDKESPVIACYLLLGSQFAHRLDDLRSERSSASALYVASSLIEMQGLNEPALAGVQWTATTLAHTIASSFGGFRPIVILDVPAAVTSTDLVHQLLLRNYFAQALIDSGAVAGVLATGLHPLPAMAELQRLILEAITALAGSSLELFDRVTALGRSMGLIPHDALFTPSPHRSLSARRPHYA